ncbi:MAG: hypothetical protein ACR2RL_23320, partial [Gammaproteobacteria bacterium]
IADLLQQEVFAFLEEGTMGANTENKEIYKKVFVKTAEYAASVPPESALAGCLDWQGNMLKQG